MTTPTTNSKPALNPAPAPAAYLHITKRDGSVVLSRVQVDGNYPAPAVSVAALAQADDPTTCALLQECARQVFSMGPLDKLGEWGNYLLCAEVGAPPTTSSSSSSSSSSSNSTAVDVGRLKTLHLTNQRGVCGYTFKKGDLCW